MQDRSTRRTSPGRRSGAAILVTAVLSLLLVAVSSGTATSAARSYCESMRAETSATSTWNGRVEVHTGYALSPHELLQTPLAGAQKRYPIVHHRRQERGGHFAAFEQPELFAEDLTTFAAVLRERAVF